MKFVFLVGGLCGFLVAGITAYCGDSQPDRILLDAAIGCLAGAALFRWLWSAFLRGFRDTYLARQHAPTPAPAAAAAAKAAKN